MNGMQKIALIFGLFVIIVAGALALLVWAPQAQAPTADPVTSFEECVEMGYPVAESNPRQCTTPSGEHFVEEVPMSTDEFASIPDTITVGSPMMNAGISSPLTISGEARGPWYFEASFPLELRDAEGNIIAQHYAEAQGDWMTTEFVPFEATLTFPAQPEGSTGTLILRKDNPSGLPENDQSLEIPVQF